MKFEKNYLKSYIKLYKCKKKKMVRSCPPLAPPQSNVASISGVFNILNACPKQKNPYGAPYDDKFTKNVDHPSS